MQPDGTLTVRVVEGVTIRFDEEAVGEVQGLEPTLGGDTMTATRIP